MSADEISVGDYVLQGGEVAALVVLDAVVRLLPGAIPAGRSWTDCLNPAATLRDGDSASCGLQTAKLSRMLGSDV